MVILLCYVAANRSVVVRLGDGADAAQGGSLGVDTATMVRFRVTIGVTCPGPVDITNQANISATGELSGEQSNYVTDGDGDASGITNPVLILLDANKAVTATFTLNTYSIAPTVGIYGSISPSTSQNVDYGSNQAFTITPDTGYQVADVLVDGVSDVASCTASSASERLAPHSITNRATRHAVSRSS